MSALRRVLFSWSLTISICRFHHRLGSSPHTLLSCVVLRSRKNHRYQSPLERCTTAKNWAYLTVMESRNLVSVSVSSQFLRVSVSNRAATNENFRRGQKSLLATVMTSSVCRQPRCNLFALISLSIKIEEMIENSENCQLLHDYYQSHILFQHKLLVSFLVIVFMKFSDVKPINQSILNIIEYKTNSRINGIVYK